MNALRLGLSLLIVVAVMSITASPMALLFGLALLWTYPRTRRWLEQAAVVTVMRAVALGAGAGMLGWTVIVVFVPQGERTTSHWISAGLLSVVMSLTAGSVGLSRLRRPPPRPSESIAGSKVPPSAGAVCACPTRGGSE